MLIRGYGTALYDAVMAPGAGERPLLFLDVDGTLLPFGLPPAQYPVFPGPVGEGVSPLLARLDPGHGARLLALPCDLVWATAWEHEANEVVAPWLGLPELPVVEFPPADEDDLRVGLHFKTRALVGWAAGRPFAWVDDEITGTDREWVRARHRGSALLHCADPLHGLTGDDYTVLARWLRNAGRASPC